MYRPEGGRQFGIPDLHLVGQRATGVFGFDLGRLAVIATTYAQTGVDGIESRTVALTGGIADAQVNQAVVAVHGPNHQTRRGRGIEFVFVVQILFEDPGAIGDEVIGAVELDTDIVAGIESVGRQ